LGTCLSLFGCGLSALSVFELNLYTKNCLNQFDKSNLHVRKTLRFLLIGVSILLGLEILRGTIDIMQLRRLPTSAAPSKFPVARGVIHVHSRYTDGSGTVEEILQAARSCSLDFVVITDHNTLAARRDGYENFHPGEPGKAGRTLLLVGEEISTAAGHVLSIGASRSHFAPGITDISRLMENIHADSGIAIIAHPDHPRLGWKRGNFGGADGIEIINADREWRNDSPLEIVDAWVGELLGLPGMHYLIDAPSENLRSWDQDSAWAGLAGIGSVDAHARFRLFGETVFYFPSYARTFSLLNTFVILHEALSCDSYLARRQVVEALGKGRCFFAFQGLGDASGFEFYAENHQAVFLPHDTLFASDSAAATLLASAPSAENVVVQLYRNGEATESAHTSESRIQITQPGVYRIIVFQERPQWPWRSRRRVPWIFSNPIYVLPRHQASSG